MQLLTLFISFLYGIFFYYLTCLNFKLIDNIKVIIKHVITFIYVLDIAIIYIIILYKLNKGYFHIYFIGMVFVGFFTGYIIRQNILSKIHVKRIFKH